MICDDLFHNASKKQKAIDCPIRIFPICHPLAHIEVFVDGKKKVITLVCSKCDRTMSTIRIK